MSLAAVVLAAQLVCPQTSSPADWSGTVLDTGTEVKNGVVYDASGARLRLQGAAGIFENLN